MCFMPELRNPKPEIRNKHEYDKSEAGWPERRSSQWLGKEAALAFGASDFEFVSDFEIRASCFCRPDKLRSV